MRKILVVVDMQNDFITGSLGTKEAEQIVQNVKNKIASYNVSDVYATKDTHESDYLETQEGKNLPVVHCVRGTAGWQFAKELLPLLEKATVVEKPTFGSTALVSLLLQENQKVKITEIEIIGLCTDICVVSNALILKAYFPEAKITVDASCTAGVTNAKHEAALETMKSCQINII